MKKLLLISFSIIIHSCTDSNSSNYFEGCSCNKIVLSNSIRITDSLNHFSFQIPDSSWLPYREISENGTMLIVGDTLNGTVRTVNVFESTFEGKWNWEAEQKNVEEEYEVLDHGHAEVGGVFAHWNLLFYRDSIPQTYAFHITGIKETQGLIYTITTQVEPVHDYLEQLCEVEPILESIEIY